MEGIIDMGSGDNTNPWDIFKAATTGFNDTENRKKKPDTGLAPAISPRQTSAAPYADPYQRNLMIHEAINAGRSANRSPEPFAARIQASPAEKSTPAFKTDFIRDFHQSVMPYVPLIASNPYKDSPFYKNDPVVDNWYKTINASANQQRQANPALNTNSYRSGLEGTIAGEPYASRAYVVPDRNTPARAVPAIQTETDIDASAYEPVKGIVKKMSPFGWVENIVGAERIKQTENAIARFLDMGTDGSTNTSARQTGQAQTSSTRGEQHGHPVAGTHPDASTSEATRQNTQTAADQGSLPAIQSETGQAYQTGQDLYEGLKTAIPDAGVGVVVAGGKIIGDAASLGGALTGIDGLKDFSRKINERSETFIKNSGSETLNRQRDAIAKVLSDPNASGADLAKAMVENPSGTLFNAGTEMAGIALPAGGAKLAQKGIQLGIKAAPKLAEWGIKALPYVPHAIQTVQGMANSLNNSEGESAGDRALKALGAGAINAAGSALSGGGIAGEVSKRLTNQITNGTVRTATDMAAAVGKQALLGAAQNTAGEVSDSLVEGKLPDSNELGKQAVKGAVDGTIAGATLHHAVVPTEGKALRQVEAAGNGNRNAHTRSKHGARTTREEQEKRANTGKAPDGSQDKWLNDSSRWLKEVDTADGIAVARRRWEEMKQKGITDKNEVTIQFDKNIGEGYIKGTNTLIKTKEAVFRFNSKGELITSYPKLRK